MKSILIRLIAMTLIVVAGQIVAFGQTAPLAGSVVDPSGAVVAGANITVKSTAGVEFKATTSSNGTFVVPAVAAGSYTVTISARGFKQAVVEDVKVNLATPASVTVTLEVGAQSESVVVQGGADVLQTQSANISTTITGRQITDLPFTSRDALDLVLLLPGTSTPGRPRTSTVNGLPKGSLNITLDGVNVQDNTLKSSDGFFTYVRPRIDAIDEVTLSTATPGAESSGEGAVQIKFVTRSGSNEFHGSVYEYHRNPFLNANYWFNNRDSVPLPGSTKAPRDRILLNQFGFRVGGPIIKDKALFFVNYEEYRLPEQVTRTRTILSQQAQNGIFQYQTANGFTAVNLYTIAAAGGQTATADPSVAKLLGEIRTAAVSGGNVRDLTDPNFQQVTFTNAGGQIRKFPTVRIDLNLSSKHRIENVWNYQKFDSVIDFLNSYDPAFPGFPNKGSQKSNRFSNSTALRSTLSNTLVNEARFGLQGGTSLFFSENSPALFANQGGYSLGITTAGISSATANRGTSRRNAPVKTFSDTVTWTRGSHNLNFGFNFTQVNYWGSSPVDGVVRAVTLGLATADPARAIFTNDANTGNFKGASTAVLTSAQNLYAVLTGRVTGITGSIALDEETSKYALNGNFVQRARQRESGIYAQDTWRFSPGMTFTGGLRWEVQYPFTALNSNFSQTTYAELFGISGANNLFKPGTQTGKVTQFTEFKKGEDQAYKTQWNAFAPSVGFAWTPNFTGKLGKILGESGRTVLRGGYSIAYNREGMNVVLSILGSNPGGTQPATQSVALGNIPTSGILLRNGLPTPTGLPTSPNFPITAVPAASANGFLPDLKTGYVQSFSFGIQREIGRDTAFEIRYVGNRGVKLWRQFAMNEYNLVENNFISEFKAAQANLAANNAAGGTRAGSFAYFGPGTNTSPLPITVAHFNGVNAANAGNQALYTSTFFRNTTFINNLNPLQPAPGTFAANLQTGNVTVFNPNALQAGLPRNLFVVNPDVITGGTWLVDNGGRSSYDAMVIEIRRRMSKGLLIQGSYAWASGFTNMYGSSSVVNVNYTSIRAPGNDKVRSPFVITHALKANWIYELPFGKGRAFIDTSNGVLERAIGGWAFHGTARLQSGAPFNFGRTVLVGMTREEAQKLIKVRKEANQVFYLPDDVILNTRRAYNPGSTLGVATGKYFAPVNSLGPEAFAGQNGFNYLNLYGPKFTRFDLSIVKTTKITERVNFEFRAEFLNAFNNINFQVGNPANDTNGLPGAASAATFGQITSAYRDTSTTNDPGGRMIQFVARINF